MTKKRGEKQKKKKRKREMRPIAMEELLSTSCLYTSFFSRSRWRRLASPGPTRESCTRRRPIPSCPWRPPPPAALLLPAAQVLLGARTLCRRAPTTPGIRYARLPSLLLCEIEHPSPNLTYLPIFMYSDLI